MNDVYWCVCEFCDSNGPVCCFAFHRRWSRKFVVLRCLLTSSHSLVDKHLYHCTIFSMDADHRTVAARDPHSPEERAIVHHQYIRVSSEQLKAGNAFAFCERCHV